VELAVDLGTKNAWLAVRGQGVVAHVPSLVAVSTLGQEVVAVGEAARRMLGRAPGGIDVREPLRDGVVADYDLTEALLRHLLRQGGRQLRRPRLMVTVSTGATASERRLLREAARAAGAAQVDLVEEPLATALGLGLDLSRPFGHMVVNVGGGATNVAVLALGGTHVGASLPVAGEAMDEAIRQHVRQRYGVAIGAKTAEHVKLTLGEAGGGRPGRIEVTGRDGVSGLPRTVEVTGEDVAAALQDPLAAIVRHVVGTLEAASPELSSDIAQEGLWLAGGGSLLPGLAEVLAAATGVPVHVAEHPNEAAVMGALAALAVKSMEDHLVLFPRVV
jgi:rod shape-determining protein MreB